VEQRPGGQCANSLSWRIRRQQGRDLSPLRSGRAACSTTGRISGEVRVTHLAASGVIRRPVGDSQRPAVLETLGKVRVCDIGSAEGDQVHKPGVERSLGALAGLEAAGGSAPAESK
jgi:hypothetical protein